MTTLRRQRVLAAKIETTSGTAETLAQGDVLYGAYDIQHQALIAFDPLPAAGTSAQDRGTTGARIGTISFKIDLRSGGTGGIPQWASSLLPACSVVATSQTYTPRTSAPGSAVKTVTLAVYQGGRRKLLRGASGNARFVFKAGHRIAIEFSFTGVYTTQTDVAMLTSAASYGLMYKFAAATFTIGGVATPCMENLTIDLGNVLYPLPCPTATDGSGVGRVIVSERAVKGTMDPESRLVATEDVFGKWIDGTEEAFSLTLVIGTDNIVFAGPKIQRTNVQEGDRSGVEIDQIDFQFNRDSQAGDDEFSITFDEV
jgi:hypothetical protein